MARWVVVVEVEAASDGEAADAVLEAVGIADFIDVYPAPADVWGEDPEFPRTDWQYQAGNGDTNLGYWAWVDHERDVV